MQADSCILQLSMRPSRAQANRIQRKPVPHVNTTTEPEQASAEDYLHAVREHSREMVRELGMLSSTYRETGLSTSESHALLELKRHPGLTVQSLAELLRLDISSASRMLQGLSKRTFVVVERDPDDGRKRLLRLTAQGEKKVCEIDEMCNPRVLAALELMSAEEREQLRAGLRNYAKALGRVRARAAFQIRPVQPADDEQLSRVIRQVLIEFECTEPETAFSDPELDQMSQCYRRPRARYYVATRGDRIVGGCGYAPLEGGKVDVCELRKMYLLPETRGLGLGEELLVRCLKDAAQDGFSHCYLETRNRMHQAQTMYRKYGFEPLNAPMGQTGHGACEHWYLRPLDTEL